MNLPAVNVLVKMTADMVMDEEIAVGLKTSIITHTNTHVVPEQTAHVEVTSLATHVKFKKTGEDSQSNDENALVKCDQKVHSVVAMTEFKKTRKDGHKKPPGKVWHERPHYCGNVCGA